MAAGIVGIALACADASSANTVDREGRSVRGGAVVLLEQDWSDIGLITTNNNWSNVPGIIGYRGDGMAGGTAVNPQTVLADGSHTPVNVTANQTAPNTLTAGGIAEFPLANPVVAFQGSGTARAPHLVLTVDTTGLSDIQVGYVLRDIDGSSDNAVQPVALHYRVGGSGNYSNLPAGFVADASTGPSQATLVTPVQVTLPADADDQTLVELRIMTTDAVGSDEWIGVDDILITGTPIAVATAPIRITEWMYGGAGGEFIELTNIGTEPVDMSGWRYDDDSADPLQGFDLSGFGTVQPGESVLLAETAPADFRSEWSLCSAVKVLGPYTNNLGRNDQINVFDAAGVRVDVLSYGDQTYPGSIRTQDVSGWVTDSGLGADDVYAWSLSVVGDAEGSSASQGGAVGSPGRSMHGGFDACAPVPGAPTIDVAPAILPAALGDPTNPSATLLLADSDTDLSLLSVTVLDSSNPAVLPLGGIQITGVGDTRTVTFQPAARGVSTVTFQVSDDDGHLATATLSYAVSSMIPDASGRYHHGISDASAALDVGDGHMLLVNDETNTLFLHRQAVSGAPVKTWTFTAAQLGGTGEIDFEGLARSGDLLIITGSHGNNRSGEPRPERRALIAATVSGVGAETELTFLGRFDGLWAQLRSWDQGDGHGLGADALGFIAATAPGVQPNPPSGFNIEAAEFAPDGQTLYLGFRAPTIGADHHALIVPVLNARALVEGTASTAQFGAPLLLDLDGRSIRSIASNAQGDYLISAGPSPVNATWALYTWNGDASVAPQFNRLLPDEDLLTGGPWESIATVPHPLVEGAIARLVTDSGDSDFYGTGATKDLPSGYQKSYSQDIVLAEVPTPVVTAPIRITEWMYGGAGGEFIELTNVGDEPVDMSGWHYDDDSADPLQGFDLSGFGVIVPGESVLLVEAAPADFRNEWSLCAGIKVLGPYSNNLGRNDQINVFDAAGVRVDVLSYGDQTYPGSIRTQDVSGWVSAAGLGADDVFAWSLSAVGDAEGSQASQGGAIGSPGRSTHGGFDACSLVIEHTVTVSLLGEGLGQVDGDGIACPGQCVATYVEGTAINLIATAQVGYVFEGWTGDCSGTAACALTVDADRAVQATFAPAPVAALRFDPTSLSFGSVDIGSASATLSATLHNDGDAAATGLVFGSIASGFVLQANGCGDSLAAGAACDVAFVFQPAVEGAASAGFDVTGDADVSASVTLSGTGVQPVLPVSDVQAGIAASHDHAQPGQTLDYLVTVFNAGPDAAQSASVESLLSPLFDAGMASWQCLGPVGSGCASSGSGNLADSGLVIAPGTAVEYLLSVQVPLLGEDVLVTQVMVDDTHDADAGNNLDEVSTIRVLFRDGFEESGTAGDGATMMALDQALSVATPVVLRWQQDSEAPTPALVQTLVSGAPTGETAAVFRVERLFVAQQTWLRLVVRDAQAGEFTSAWAPVNAATQQLSLALVPDPQADAITPRGELRLSVDSGSVLRLPLPIWVDGYALRSVLPLAD